MKTRGFYRRRFRRSQPRRLGLGHPLGRDPSRKIDVVSSQQRLGGGIQQKRLVDGGFAALRGQPQRRHG